jgi:hypothetical protein
MSKEAHEKLFKNLRLIFEIKTSLDISRIDFSTEVTHLPKVHASVNPYFMSLNAVLTDDL